MILISELFLQPKYSSNKEYKQGYSFGISPVFLEYENLDYCGTKFRNETFKIGFCDGRKLFNHLNGSNKSLPSVILTINNLYSSYSDGAMNRNCEFDNQLTNYQTAVMKFYHNLVKEENHSSLYSVLNILQIEILK